MSRLRYPVNFVTLKGSVWPELEAGRPQDIDEEKLADYTVGSLNGWIIRTYFHFLSTGEPVTISKVPQANAINIVSPRDFGRKNRRYDRYIVVPRADGHRPMLADFVINQNIGLPVGRSSANIPYWPQANILPRQQSRPGISRISFKGRLLNLDDDFKSTDFRSQLEKIGVEFFVDAFNGLLGEQSWNDYTGIDAVLAVRNLTIKDARHKPAGKLVNSWFGEVPAILGPEPAYRALRETELDYIEVNSPTAAIQALKRLQSTPRLYDAMVENGRKRRQKFTQDAILDVWIDTINGKIGPSFENWRKRSNIYKWWSCMGMYAAEPFSKKYYKHYIHNGPRLLDQSGT